MRLPSFEYLSPKSVEEACSLLAHYQGNTKALAGGTDLLVELKKRASGQGYGAADKKEMAPHYIIGLRGISGLARIEYSPDEGLILGPMTTYAHVAESFIAREKYPLLWHACRIFSRPQIRHAGTLVGNLCNASPSADIVPPLIALGAKARIVSARAEREVPVEEFCLGPFKTVLKEDELVAELKIPENSQFQRWSYERATKRTAEDEALVIAAIQLQFADEERTVKKARIVLGSVAPRPTRAPKAEAALEGKKLDEDLIREASQLAPTEVNPRSRPDYRRLMTSYLVRKGLTEAARIVSSEP